MSEDATHSANSDHLIDIIMPARNAQATIMQAIHSVQSQSVEKWRLLIIIDGSTDSTVELSAQAAAGDPRISVIEQSHRGVSAARNRGIDASSAELIGFIDADDLWLPDKLDLQLSCLEEHTTSGAVITSLDRFFEDPAQSCAHTRLKAEPVTLKELQVYNVVGNGSNMLVRRSVVDAVGQFNESLAHAEDWEFSVRICARTTIMCIPQVCSLYRQNDSSASRKLLSMSVGHRRAIRTLCKHGIDFDADTLRHAHMVHTNYLATQAISRRATLGSSIAGIAFLICSIFLSRGNHRRRQEAGLTRSNVAYRLNVLLRQAFDSLRSRLFHRNNIRMRYEETGIVPGTKALSDHSVLPLLLNDADKFRTELARYKHQNIAYRVPYLLTDAIEKIAADPEIVRLVQLVFGKNTPWVMWGANIRDGVPNDASYWHVDSESRFWETLTVVVGLAGCIEDNATLYIPYTQHHGKMPDGDIDAMDINGILSDASSHDPRSDRLEYFDGFGNGRFYAFNAAGWHCGNPASGGNRTLLFMHYQRACDARIPYMDNYLENTWQAIAAPYVSGRTSAGSQHSTSTANTNLQDTPPQPRPFRAFCRY